MCIRDRSLLEGLEDLGSDVVLDVLGDFDGFVNPLGDLAARFLGLGDDLELEVAELVDRF